MGDVRPDEARKFYEEDEDSARVFSIFDAAERQGRLRRTAPPDRSELVPLPELLGQLWRELKELRLWERAVKFLHRVTAGSRSKVG